MWYDHPFSQRNKATKRVGGGVKQNSKFEIYQIWYISRTWEICQNKVDLVSMYHRKYKYEFFMKKVKSGKLGTLIFQLTCMLF